MELGATVCRGARGAALRRLPGRAARAARRPARWTSRRAAGPATDAAPERFEDSNRWVRGRVVEALAAGAALPDGHRARAARAGDRVARPRRPGPARRRGLGFRADALGFAPWPWTVRASSSATSPSAAGATSPRRSTRTWPRIAEEVEDLQRRRGRGRRRGERRSAKASPASIAQAASEQVPRDRRGSRVSAAAIEQSAQDDAARDPRSDARVRRAPDARRRRRSAASEHVGQVSSATKQMLQRVDAMESELNGLVESLRTGANRLTADLVAARGRHGRPLRRRRPRRGRGRRRGRTPRAVESVPLAVAADDPAAEAAAAEAETGADEPEPRGDAGGGRAGRRGDGRRREGARLVALNMALNGTSREETDRYLAENFDLADRAALLDEVYATVES